MEKIVIKSLSKYYGKEKNKVIALDEISLKIKKGEFIAIVGASGSGKSTLLHMIGGVDKPTSGEVIIDDIDITKLNERELALFRLRKIGFVFQRFNLISVLSVEENIEMPCLLDDENIDEIYKEELLTMLGIKDKRDSMIDELSGGQMQRVAIGRALANKPEIILADEPTGNLDSNNAMEVLELLKYSARKYNQTLIVITHDEKIALEADRIFIIKEGTLKEKI
ncbi:MAG: ABC transporter ATP-binding protein [Clostridium sp.]|uniref:ABC transporter ATP-binding protein n=1 Tax=Clostridium sp. TaxID=1506 RepID=UPI003F334387